MIGNAIVNNYKLSRCPWVNTSLFLHKRFELGNKLSRYFGAVSEPHSLPVCVSLVHPASVCRYNLVVECFPTVGANTDSRKYLRDHTAIPRLITALSLDPFKFVSRFTHLFLCIFPTPHLVHGPPRSSYGRGGIINLWDSSDVPDTQIFKLLRYLRESL